MCGPHYGANIDCTAEYKWENNSSLREKLREREREKGWSVARKGGDRDSTRPVSGLRVRLVKSFAGIMNPPRVVIRRRGVRPADVTIMERLFAATKTKGLLAVVVVAT